MVFGTKAEKPVSASISRRNSRFVRSLSAGGMGGLGTDGQRTGKIAASGEERLDVIFEQVVLHAPSHDFPVLFEGLVKRCSDLSGSFERDVDELAELAVVLRTRLFMHQCGEVTV